MLRKIRIFLKCCISWRLSCTYWCLCIEGGHGLTSTRFVLRNFSGTYLDWMLIQDAHLVLGHK